MKVLLLIDDDVEDHETIKQAFYAEDPGAHIICFEDCAEAISKLESHESAHFHAIMVDMHMPRTSGLECLKALRRIPRLTNTSIIMISSQFHEDDLDVLCRHGAKALCVKPSTWEGYRMMAEIILSDSLNKNTLIRPS